ncbi:DUF2167 domain-containing protein [Massilia terrae]
MDAVAQSPKIDAETEMKAAVAAAQAVVKNGPVDIPLANQATLKLPENYSFIPQPEAGRIMKAMGNGDDPTRLGIIIPPDNKGMVIPRFIDSGYIKDDEARDWKVDELLDSIREGTKEGNKERAARGFPEMEVMGWTQRPAYDAKTHRLAWAIESKDKGAPADAEHGVNFNTYVLGREGYLSMNLVASLPELAETKPHLETLLAQTSFNPGKTYADFHSGTDRVAEYGIAALVTGLAVKKLGLFAIIAAFALKFFKLIAVAALALIAGIRSFFKRKNEA